MKLPHEQPSYYPHSITMFEDCKVELLETFGNDLTVVNAARVSLGKHVDEFTDKDAKLGGTYSITM